MKVWKSFRKIQTHHKCHKCSLWLSLALVISLSQCTGACWEFSLEPLELPFILSGVCSPSEANYCSNPFEVLINALNFFALLMILHYSLTILNINALSLIFFINANTLNVITKQTVNHYDCMCIQKRANRAIQTSYYLLLGWFSCITCAAAKDKLHRRNFGLSQKLCAWR